MVFIKILFFSVVTISSGILITIKLKSSKRFIHSNMPFIAIIKYDKTINNIKY